jgi:formate dehydrogenase subunit gamma
MNVIKTLLVVLSLAAAGPVWAQQAASAPAATGAPPGFTAPALPKPEDSNAERAKSQPSNNAPFWRGVRNSGDNAGYTSLPGTEKGVLVQRFVQYPGSRYTTAGEAWREVRNRWIVPYGGALLVIALLAMALMHWRVGPLGHATNDAPTIERFTPFERAAHWTNAIAFVLLALSGIVIAFGRTLMLPWMGAMLFGWLAYALKTLHNFVGPLFVVSLVIVIVTFIRDELPRREDWTWLRHARGAIHGHEVPSHRFNAGEKVIFWAGVLGLGLIVVASGLVLDHLVPNIEYTRATMQIAHMVHAVATVLMMAMFVLHIYLGTIGMKGAYRAMRDGWVDEEWADEHHKLWADDVRAGKIPAQRSGNAGPDALKGRPA